MTENETKTNRTTEVLAAEWLAAKKTEADANKARCDIEDELVAALAFDKPEGSKTFNIDGFKVELKAKLNRKIDLKVYHEKVEDKIPAHLRPTKMVETLDEAGVKYLAENEPKLYKLLATVLTITPAKIGCTVTRKD